MINEISVPAPYNIDLARGNGAPWSLKKTTHVLASRPVGERVQQPTHRRICQPDCAIEVGEVAADFRDVRLVVGDLDVFDWCRLVSITRPRPVRLEEPCRQQERTTLLERGALGKPFLRPGDYVFAVGIGYIELVETEPRWVGRLVLHPEQR